MLEAGYAVAVAGAVAGAVEDLGGLLVEDVVDQGALAGAGDAGDADELPQGDADVDVLEVVLAGALDGQGEAVAGPARLRERYLPTPDRYWPVMDRGLAMI